MKLASTRRLRPPLHNRPHENSQNGGVSSSRLDRIYTRPKQAYPFVCSVVIASVILLRR
jgi:hypothetical protein